MDKSGPDEIADASSHRASELKAEMQFFGMGVTVSVTFEDKSHFLNIVLLQFIELDAIYLESEAAGRTLYECESSESTGKPDEQAKSQCTGFCYANK